MKNELLTRIDSLLLNLRDAWENRSQDLTMEKKLLEKMIAVKKVKDRIIANFEKYNQKYLPIEESLEVDVEFLKGEKISEIPLIKDFITFLKFLEESPARLTHTKNLSLKDLKELNARLHSPIDIQEMGFPIRSENEMPYLQKIDILSQLLKLTMNRKGKRILTKLGAFFIKGLSAEVQYMLIFGAFWSELNWSFFFPYEPGGKPIAKIIQNQRYEAIESFLELSLDNWADVKVFCKKVADRLKLSWKNIYGEEQENSRTWTVERVLIDNFALFGIIECLKEKDRFGFESITKIRLTSLGKKIIDIPFG